MSSIHKLLLVLGIALVAMAGMMATAEIAGMEARNDVKTGVSRLFCDTPDGYRQIPTEVIVDYINNKWVVVNGYFTNCSIKVN